MSFLIDNFSTTGSNARKGEAPQQFSYESSTDTIATIKTGNYFGEASFQIDADDMISVIASDGMAIMHVTSSDPVTQTVVIDSNVISNQGGSDSSASFHNIYQLSDFPIQDDDSFFLENGVNYLVYIDGPVETVKRFEMPTDYSKGGSLIYMGNRDILDWTYQGTVEPMIVSAEAIATTSFSVGTQDSFPGGIAFNDDGTKMFMVGLTTTKVYEYDLSLAYDVVSAVVSANEFSVSTQTNFPFGIAFNLDGTKMYIVDGINAAIFEYALSTGFNVSTAVVTDSFDVSSEALSPVDVKFNNDGTKMFVLDELENEVFEYNVSPGFDISTSVYSNNSFNFFTQDSKPEGISFNDDGLKLFMVGQDHETVYEYDLTTAFSLASGVTYSNQSFAVGRQAKDVGGVIFNGDGSNLYVLGRQNQTIFQYSLSPPYTLPVSRQIGSFLVRGFNFIGATGAQNAIDIDATSEIPTQEFRVEDCRFTDFNQLVLMFNGAHLTMDNVEATQPSSATDLMISLNRMVKVSINNCEFETQKTFTNILFTDVQNLRALDFENTDFIQPVSNDGAINIAAAENTSADVLNELGQFINCTVRKSDGTFGGDFKLDNQVIIDTISDGGSGTVNYLTKSAHGLVDGDIVQIWGTVQEDIYDSTGIAVDVQDTTNFKVNQTFGSTGKSGYVTEGSFSAFTSPRMRVVGCNGIQSPITQGTALVFQSATFQTGPANNLTFQDIQYTLGAARNPEIGLPKDVFLSSGSDIILIYRGLTTIQARVSIHFVVDSSAIALDFQVKFQVDGDANRESGTWKFSRATDQSLDWSFETIAQINPGETIKPRIAVIAGAPVAANTFRISNLTFSIEA